VHKLKPLSETPLKPDFQLSSAVHSLVTLTLPGFMNLFDYPSVPIPSCHFLIYVYLLVNPVYILHILASFPKKGFLMHLTSVVKLSSSYCTFVISALYTHMY